MEKRRDALEAYRKARAAGANEAVPDPPPPSQYYPPPPDSRPRQAPRTMETDIQDPVANASRNYEMWIATNDARNLIEHYGLLSNPGQRRKVLTWAVEQARHGNLDPLLGIGIDDTEPSVQKHLNSLLHTLPGEILLSKIIDGRFTIKERRTVAGLLGRCKDPQAGRLLASMAEHHDARVRESALQALTHYPISPELQLPICKRHLEKDAHPGVRIRAAEGLVRLGTPAAIAALESACKAEGAPPEVHAMFAATQAKRRPRSDLDIAEIETPKNKNIKKPFPAAMIGKVFFVLLSLAIAGWRLSPQINRWYAKTFPPAPAAQTAPAK